MKEVEAVKDLATVSVISNLLTKHKSQQFADVWNLGINLALRISDLLELKFDDLTGTHVTVIEKKTKKPRTIKLNDKAKAIIERLRSENPNDVFLFQSKSRNMKAVNAITRQAVGKAFSEIGEMVSVHLSTHSMRKTRGYHVYKQTNNLALVMKMLNHSSPSVTLRYIGIDQEELDSISDSISL
mgnify:CR=1 FL=1|jgi:integrase